MASISRVDLRILVLCFLSSRDVSKAVEAAAVSEEHGGKTPMHLVVMGHVDAGGWVPGSCQGWDKRWGWVEEGCLFNAKLLVACVTSGLHGQETS
jgi:hypothetical protein